MINVYPCSLDNPKYVALCNFQKHTQHIQANLKGFMQNQMLALGCVIFIYQCFIIGLPAHKTSAAKPSLKSGFMKLNVKEQPLFMTELIMVNRYLQLATKLSSNYQIYIQDSSNIMAKQFSAKTFEKSTNHLLANLFNLIFWKYCD